MTPQEANKIIAEFMGYETDGSVIAKAIAVVKVSDGEPDYIGAYSEYLDSLAPVWEKLNLDGGWVYDSCGGKESWIITFTGKEDSGEWCPTIQEAAAIATAKAIQEMGK